MLYSHERRLGNREIGLHALWVRVKDTMRRLWAFWTQYLGRYFGPSSRFPHLDSEGKRRSEYNTDFYAASGIASGAVVVSLNRCLHLILQRRKRAEDPFLVHGVLVLFQDSGNVLDFIFPVG